MDYSTCLYLFDTRFLSTEIIICSFNNNALKKCANGKAFYIVATVSAQFFTTLIQERLVVLGCCLLVAEVNFHNKFASLRQVNSPNIQDKFQICCNGMYLVRYLVNFTVFWMCLGILQHFTDLHEIHGSRTAQNARSPVY